LGLEIVVSSGLGTVTPGDDAVLIQTHTDKGSTSQYVEYVLNFAVSMMTENQTFKKPGETGQATQLAPEYTEDWLKFRGYGARRDVGDSYYSETDLMHVSFPQELNKTERPELTQLMWNNMLEAARRLIITTTEGEKREPCFTTKDNRFNHLKQKETFNYTRFQTVFQTAMKLAVLEGRVLLNRKMVGHVLTEQRNDAFFKDLWLEDTRTNSGEEQKRCSNGLSKCIFDGETRTLNMKSPRLLILMAIQSLLASATEIKVGETNHIKTPTFPATKSVKVIIEKECCKWWSSCDFDQPLFLFFNTTDETCKSYLGLLQDVVKGEAKVTQHKLKFNPAEVKARMERMEAMRKRKQL